MEAPKVGKNKTSLRCWSRAGKLRKAARSGEINFLLQSQPNNEEGERGEAELQHIPATAVSNDVTFRKKERKNKEERKQKWR